MTASHLVDGMSVLAQFLVPALLISWADRRRQPRAAPATNDGDH